MRKRQSVITSYSIHYTKLYDPLPGLDRGDRVAVLSAGAYGASMSSNYNSRPLASEAVVYRGRWHVARDRQSLDDLMRGEHPLPL